MADRTKSLAIPTRIFQVATGTGGVVNCDIAGKTNLRFYVTSISMSWSAAPTAGVITLKDNTLAVTLDEFQIPAAALAPVVVVYGTHPIELGIGSTTRLTSTTPGAATVELVLKGYFDLP